MKVEAPECERLHEVHEQSQAIGEFLDWYAQQGWQRMRWATFTDDTPCEYEVRKKVTETKWVRVECDGGKLTRRHSYEDIWQEDCPRCGGTGLVPVERQDWAMDNRSLNTILAEYFNIDLAKVDRERKAILDMIREK